MAQLLMIVLKIGQISPAKQPEVPTCDGIFTRGCKAYCSGVGKLIWGRVSMWRYCVSHLKYKSFIVREMKKLHNSMYHTSCFVGLKVIVIWLSLYCAIHYLLHGLSYVLFINYFLRKIECDDSWTCFFYHRLFYLRSYLLEKMSSAFAYFAQVDFPPKRCPDEYEIQVQGSPLMCFFLFFFYPDIKL